MTTLLQKGKVAQKSVGFFFVLFPSRFFLLFKILALFTQIRLVFFKLLHELQSTKEVFSFLFNCAVVVIVSWVG